MQRINIYEAIRQMRKLTKDNVPFNFSYCSCNTTEQKSDGLKTVKRALLGTGLSLDRGIKSQSLVAYTDIDTGKKRWFYLPLLISFNNAEVVWAEQ